jgi:RNA 3'-terminal phosphate cyclase (ATP)
MIKINGGHKSGSGTIVRDAVSLSALTGQVLHITNIRTKRDKPGLRSQHLKGAEACRQICQGRIENAKVGSKEIRFWPGERLCGGKYYFDIGTAGSTALLTSILLPISIFCDEAATFKITGGLFQDFAPSAYYLKHVLFPVLHHMGIDAELKILQAGYYPKGHGSIQVKTVQLRQKLHPITLLEQGEVLRIDGFALSSLLEERKVSDRMAEACQISLRAKGYNPAIRVIYDTKQNPTFNKVSIQAGASLAIWAKTENKCLIGSDMAGALKRSAENIGKQVAINLIDDLETGATVDRYLADQLIPFCALADGTSEYLIPRVTQHVETRLWLVEEILGAKTQIKDNRVIIKGIGYQR